MINKLFFAVLLILLVATGCTSQENVVSAKSPSTASNAENTSSSRLPSLEEQFPRNESNETAVAASVFPTDNTDETEIKRQKQYSTLLDFTNLRFEECPKLESELRLRLEQVRDNMENLERGIDDAYDKIIEERFKDEQLSQSGATPAQLSRQKEYVKEAEQLHTRRLLERDEAKRLEQQLFSTLDALHDECIKAEIREKKEVRDVVWT